MLHWRKTLALSRLRGCQRNGDGRDNILWQNSDSLVYVWLLNARTITGAGGLSGVGAEWSIVGGG